MSHLDPEDVKPEGDCSGENLPDLEAILNPPHIVCPDFSECVIEAWEADMANPPLPCQYDDEFLSAYFDQSLHSAQADPVLSNHRIIGFERHLPHCPSCNQKLWRILETHAAYRQHLYRLEDNLAAFDISQQVMAAYEADQDADVITEDNLPAMGCGQFPFELMSALLDEELTETEEHLMKSHLADCDLCQQAYHAMQNAQDLVQRHLSDSLYPSKIPKGFNFWPRIESMLTPSAHEKPKNQVYRFKRLIPLASVAIAAGVCLFLFSGRLLPTLPNQSHSASVDPIALQAAIMADEKDLARNNNLQLLNTSYQSPEAYLLTTELDENMPQKHMNEKKDVSAYLFNP